MHFAKSLTRPSVVLLAGLCTALLVCEAMRVQAGKAVLQAHQMRWDCLAQKTSEVPRCVNLLKQRPRDDADFCEEAVARCKASRTYDGANKTEARYDMWFKLAAWLRMTLFACAIGWLTWYGIVQPIRRKLRATFQ